MDKRALLEEMAFSEPDKRGHGTCDNYCEANDLFDGKPPRVIAAPEPEEEPPGWCAGFQGLRAGGKGRSKAGPPMANSCVASLPGKRAPASRSRASADALVDRWVAATTALRG